MSSKPLPYCVSLLSKFGVLIHMEGVAPSTPMYFGSSLPGISCLNKWGKDTIVPTVASK